eukprot:68486_1
MRSLLDKSICYGLYDQQKETCLTKLEDALFPSSTTTNNQPGTQTTNNSAFDEDVESKSNPIPTNNDNTTHKRDQIGNYLYLCRNNTIENESALNVLLPANHTNLDPTQISAKHSKSATFWICDMIKSDCLWMYISSKDTFLVNHKLDIYRIHLHDSNNFAKICVDSSNPNDFTILQGSFMDKSAERKEFLIEDVVCYKSELLTSTLFDRMQMISKTVGNYRGINTKPSIYPFDFRGKPWIANNSGKGCMHFFKWFRTSSSTGSIMFHDNKHPENFSKGYMIWSNAHVPVSDASSMLNFVYPPKFFVQIQLPIQARHNTSNWNNNGQQIGMTNKNGIVQDFNANMTNQAIQMFLRNDLDGIRTVAAIKAQFDSKSMENLIQISQTNTYKQWLLCQIMYNKQKSCYTLVNIWSQSKIQNAVEKNAQKYNDLLLKCQSTSTVHSASEREKITLLTSSVTEFVKNCTHIIQSCAKENIVEAFQSISKPFILKQQQQKHRQKQHHSAQHHHQQQQQHHNGHSNTYRQFVPDPPPDHSQY